MSRYRDVIGVHGADGPVATVRAFVRAGRVRSASAEGGRPGRACVMSLPGEQVFLRVLAFTPQPGVRQEDALAEQISHFDEGGEVETVRALGRPGRMGGRHSVLFALARGEAVDAAFREAAAGGYELVDLVPASLALYNGARVQVRRRGVLLCLLVGRETTDLFLGRGRVPLMARRLAVGMRALDAGADVPGAWAAWAGEVKAALDFAEALWPEADVRPQTAVVCADRPWTAGERERLQTVLRCPCLDATELPEARASGAGPGFTPALGCARAGLGRVPMPLSVFPKAARERQALQRQSPWWAAAAVCAVLGMLLPSLRIHQARVYHRRHAQRLQGRIQMLSGLEQELLSLQASNQALRRGMAPLRGTVHGSEAARRVLHAVASAKHENDWIILAADADRYQIVGRVAAGRAPARSGVPIEHLVIEGYTPAHDLSTVRAMIERLRRYPFIAEVDLLADDRLRQDAARDTRWAPLECRLFALEIRTAIP